MTIKTFKFIKVALLIVLSFAFIELAFTDEKAIFSSTDRYKENSGSWVDNLFNFNDEDEGFSTRTYAPASIGFADFFTSRHIKNYRAWEDDNIREY